MFIGLIRLSRLTKLAKMNCLSRSCPKSQKRNNHASVKCWLVVYLRSNKRQRNPLSPSGNTDQLVRWLFLIIARVLRMRMIFWLRSTQAICSKKNKLISNRGCALKGTNKNSTLKSAQKSKLFAGSILMGMWRRNRSLQLSYSAIRTPSSAKLKRYRRGKQVRASKPTTCKRRYSLPSM